MHEIKYKYIIGTQVMFYEIDMLPDFVYSVQKAIEMIQPKYRSNITIDFLLNCTEYYEKIDRSKINGDIISELFSMHIHKLEELGVNVVLNVKGDDIPYTMVNYRRDINNKYASTHDYVIWGETDCLVPSEIFIALDEAKTIANSNGIYRYITTFATRKMWDDSWIVLEHPEFAPKAYHERHEVDKWENDPSSIHYTMNQKEMQSVNDKARIGDMYGFDFRIMDKPKFDGSILCISSDLILAGANIPLGFWGLSAEDTAFMQSCVDVTRGHYRQIVVANILKVHNRNHPNKRRYALEPDGNESTQAKKGELYNRVRDLNKLNLAKYLQPQGEFLREEKELLKLEKERII